MADVEFSLLSLKIKNLKLPSFGNALRSIGRAIAALAPKRWPAIRITFEPRNPGHDPPQITHRKKR